MGQGETPLRVRGMVPEDFLEVIALCLPAAPAAADLAHLLGTFPAGQLVAETADGQLLGTAASLIIARPEADGDLPGESFLGEHDPDKGDTLFIAQLTVAAGAGDGVVQALVTALEDLAIGLGLQGMRYEVELPAAMPAGDPQITLLLGLGFVIRTVVPETFGPGFIAVLDWLNPNAGDSWLQRLPAAAPLD